MVRIWRIFVLGFCDNMGGTDGKVFFPHCSYLYRTEEYWGVFVFLPSTPVDGGEVFSIGAWKSFSNRYENIDGVASGSFLNIFRRPDE
jgi:hypothetical protein